MPGPGAYLIGDEEKKEVMEVLEARYLSRYGKVGDPRFQKKVVSFEKKFAEKLGTRYCLAVSSGTGALMAALIALGVGPGVNGRKSNPRRPGAKRKNGNIQLRTGKNHRTGAKRKPPCRTNLSRFAYISTKLPGAVG